MKILSLPMVYDPTTINALGCSCTKSDAVLTANVMTSS